MRWDRVQRESQRKRVRVSEREQEPPSVFGVLAILSEARTHEPSLPFPSSISLSLDIKETLPPPPPHFSRLGWTFLNELSSSPPPSRRQLFSFSPPRWLYSILNSSFVDDLVCHCNWKRNCSLPPPRPRPPPRACTLLNNLLLLLLPAPD